LTLAASARSWKLRRPPPYWWIRGAPGERSGRLDIVRDDRDLEAHMADVLSELRSSLEKRLREALDALKGVGKRAQATAAGAAKRSRTARAATVARGPGRPRGTGGRAQEVLALVHKHPGITLAEIAKRMKIQPNYLYRVFSHLEKDGSVTKRDKGYHPPES
jgi:hypothetical protein